MSRLNTTRIQWVFWAVCIVGLLWNVGGAMNYVMQTDAEFVDALPETHQAIIVNRPAWATAAFAVGVFGGALGCVLMMFRTSGAQVVLGVSLIGIVFTVVHMFNVARQGTTFSAVEYAVMAMLPVLVAVALLIYARRVCAAPNREP